MRKCSCDPKRHASCGCKIFRSDNSDGTGWTVNVICVKHMEMVGNGYNDFHNFKLVWIAGMDKK